MHIILSWDNHWYELISQGWFSAPLFYLFTFITNLADLAILTLSVYLVLLFAKRRVQAQKGMKVISVLLPVMIAAVITIVLKLIIHRGTPTSAFSPWLRIELLPEWYVFPSGHTSRAFALAAITAKLYPRWRVPLYCGAALIGFSRVYVGAHYPTDVIAGAILGTIVSMVYWRLNNPSPLAGEGVG